MLKKHHGWIEILADLLLSAISGASGDVCRRHILTIRGIMRLLSILSAILFAAILSISTTASAETRKVPANKTSAVTFIYYSTGKGYNCLTSGRGKYHVAREAEHGTVRLEWRKVKGDFQRGCKGTTMNGLAVWYTPHKGYRGKDVFTVQMRVPGIYPGNMSNQGRSWKIKVDVE
jgi:hypothetical protein